MLPHLRLCGEVDRDDTVEMKYEECVTTESVELQDIKVGDILELKDGETIPADCLLIWTEDRTGKAFLQTAALDGELSLKNKLAHKQLMHRLLPFLFEWSLALSEKRDE